MHHRAVNDQHIFARNIMHEWCKTLLLIGEDITYSAFSAYSSVTVTLRGMWVLLLVNVTVDVAIPLRQNRYMTSG